MIAETILLAGIAGFAAFAGALFACLDRKKSKTLGPAATHAILSFGGGALIGAVGLVLVPDGLKHQPLWLGAVTFLLGGVVFLCLDRYLTQRGTPVSQLVALMLDFVPESIVLGAVISQNFGQAVFLAVIISAQNLPEGFNAYREIRQSHASFLRQHVLGLMALCVFVGPLAALTGLLVFSPDSPALGALMTFCAGGILYLVFQDVAPQARLERSWYPAFGAVLGFTVGLIGFGLVS